MKRAQLCLLAGLICADVWGGELPLTEWCVDLKEGGSAPTLYPGEDEPEGVVLTDGHRLLWVDGQGQVREEELPRRAAGSPVTVADLDGDGDPETIVTLVQGGLLCLNQAGEELWSFDTGAEVGGFKAVVAEDVHPHPGLEVIFGFNDGLLRCLSCEGDLLWRFFGDRFRVGGISVGDADGDGTPEIVYGTDNGHIYCLDGWGDVEWRFSELAPYGRSGINLADLHGDGTVEVLVTRSNVNNKACLIALRGSDGSLLWRTKDVMQGYVSNAPVDLDGDGRLEVLHADKGNNVYAENADGTRRWKATLDARGIFWAPAVGDLDGDGHLEIVPPLRGASPKEGVSCAVLSDQGEVLQSLQIAGGTNAGPAMGDVDGDGELELLLLTQSPHQIHCLTWKGGGSVGWPSLRGDSRMTGRSKNVSVGSPEKRPLVGRGKKEEGEARLIISQIYRGKNAWELEWEEPVQAESFLELNVSKRGEIKEGRIFDLKEGAQHTPLEVELKTEGVCQVTVKLWHRGGEPGFALRRKVKPEKPWRCGIKEVEKDCDSSLEAGRRAGADTSGLIAERSKLRTMKEQLQEEAKGTSQDAVISRKATALRKRAQKVQSLAQLLGSLWEEGWMGTFLCWEDPNPWDSFDPEELPDSIPDANRLHFKAFGNEFEDKAISILNVTDRPLDVRCAFTEPSTGQSWYRPELPPADAFTLRRCVAVSGHWKDRVFDALPELDRSRSITVPPGEIRQLWLVLNTYDLQPGNREISLFLGSLEKQMTVHEIPVMVEVAPIDLPTGVYSKMNWTRVDFGTASNQGVRDLVEHGMSVSYGPALPRLVLDEKGRLAEEVDWSSLDRVLDRVPRPWTFLWGGPPPVKWPEGMEPKEDSDLEKAGFRTAILTLAEHMLEKGFEYRDWAFYPIDEPWNTGFTHIPHLKRFCERVKWAVPQAQVYTDPAGLVRAEYLEEFKDLIDIWQPELNTLKRDPKLVEWFQENADRFWFYEAPGPAKDFLPLGHYRAFGWYAWHFGTEGGGYWVYKATDIWWPIEGSHYSAVYQTNRDVVPSRRWEADRDGIEDYRLLYLLREEARKAEEAGRRKDAERALQLVSQAVEDVIGWNLRNIDEITRITRDHEIEFDRFLEYREKLAEEVFRLRGVPQ